MAEDNKWIRNPLSLFGVFVSLCYGVASIVMGLNFKYLSGPCERLPLIWFIVLFPIMLLTVVTVLVVVCPKKLYGPGDYDDETIFYRLMTDDEKRQRDIDEIKESENERNPSSSSNPPINQLLSFFQNCNNYALAQEEKRLGIRLIKDAYFVTSNNIQIRCDAFGRNKRIQYFIEAKYVKELKNSISAVEHLKEQYYFIRDNYPDKHFEFLVAFTYKHGSEEDVADITRQLKVIDNRIQVHFYELPSYLANIGE